MTDPLQTPSPLIHASKLKTALLLIDVQSGLTVESGYYGTERSTPNLEQNVALLLSTARAYNSSSPQTGQRISIVHVYHHSSDPRSPLNPGKKTVELMPCAKPMDGEMLICKTTASAFVNTDLERVLRGQDVRQLLVCGVSTDHCVSSSFRMAADLGVVKKGRQMGVGHDGQGSGMDWKGDHGGNDDDGLEVLALIEDACAAFNKPGKFDAETVHQVHVASLANEFGNIATTSEVCEIVLSQGQKQ